MNALVTLNAEETNIFLKANRNRKKICFNILILSIYSKGYTVQEMRRKFYFYVEPYVTFVLKVLIHEKIHSCLELQCITFTMTKPRRFLKTHVFYALTKSIFHTCHFSLLNFSRAHLWKILNKRIK